MNLQRSLFGESEPIPQTPLEYLTSQQSPHPDSPVVVSYGGGKNSTALLILCKKLDIKVDLILFADTGGEIPETYEFIEVFNQWLFDNGMPKITIVRRSAVGSSKNREVLNVAIKNFCFLMNSGLSTTQLLHWSIWWLQITSHNYQTLEENCLVTNTLPSKAYGRSSCSLAWKVEPQDDYVEDWMPAVDAWGKGLLVRKLIGYHAKELSRLLDKKTGSFRDVITKKYKYEYPLIEHGLDDIGCQVLIASEGLPIPPKSSCFFCPNRKTSEILNLPEELRLRGNLIESVAKGGIHWKDNTSVKGLGRSFAWDDIGRITPLEQALLDMQKETKQCHCVD